MDKKQRIIITMLELVVKQGVYATPMSQVAKEANVAVGTIYHYFNNKQEILEEIYKLINQDFGVVLMANLPDDEYRKQFETVCLNFFNYYVGNPLAFKFMEFVAVPPLISLELSGSVREYITDVKDFFLKGIEEGYLKDAQLRHLMLTTAGCITSTIKLKEKNAIEITNDVINQTMEMAWDCVRKH
ncbi:TetR/AcrR family transcriptional regulator [Mesoflavibacter profundi]|uniref:TetR/AcrR family transcriptional regulator n=1 Tax=Mesoflavibacter profundi TaxID=2708110 RepID=A0ABT4S0F1_9FLAO|nr:TetR/AcrR family transcriptional regulator [Mesoflavibacter profundi]MDA0177539.1 TetR/AcrR family transcriptional regulator [Mesoflavibacter profundi]